MVCGVWVLFGCGDDPSPGLGESGGRDTESATSDTDTDTGTSDTDTGTSDTDTSASACVGDGANEGDGATGGPDPGDAQCGDGEICVIDECVASPYAHLEACDPAIDFETQDISVPIGAVVAADFDGDGADELWGYRGDADAIEVFDAEGNQLASIEIGEYLLVDLVPVHADSGPEGVAVIGSVGQDEHVVMYVWPQDDGLDVSTSATMPNRSPADTFAHDFDSDGTVELVVGFREQGLELWSLAPATAPVLLDGLDHGGRPATLQPLPGGGGLGIALPLSGEVEYLAASSLGLESVGLYAHEGSRPLGYGAFLDPATLVPALSGGEALSEFDSFTSFGLGVFEETTLTLPEPYDAPLDLMLRILAVDFDGDGRDEAVALSNAGGAFIRFDAEGVPCQTAAALDVQATLGDLDGDGDMELIQPVQAGVRVFSAP